jgi:hypothetical protein
MLHKKLCYFIAAPDRAHARLILGIPEISWGIAAGSTDFHNLYD